MNRIVVFIIAVAVFGFSSIRAGVLSGTIVGTSDQPLSGCAVCLLKAALTDTTVGGTFQFADVPVSANVPGNAGISRMQGRTLYVYVGKRSNVSLSIFDLRGRMVAEPLDNQQLRRGTYRFDPLSFVQNASARGVYAVKVTVDGRTVVHPLMAAGAMPSRAPLQKKAEEVASAAASPDDTLLITCPGYAAKIIPVNSYSAALGKIAVARATAAAFTEVVFAVRTTGITWDMHWYANIGYKATDPTRKVYGTNGYLCKLNMQTKAVTNLISDPTGSVRDPVVSYDGLKILFSWRKGGTEDYNLYEINVNGTGIKQITSGPWNDFEPCYLPDGGIVFVSTRCNRYVNCWVTQVANVYRCDGDGKNIRMLSPNVEHDNTPWLLPDGRVLYTRWEYVDRNQVTFHHLWYMRPDGTGQMVYFGNLHPWDVFIDAKPIPGTNKVVMVNSSSHGLPEHAGRIAIVSDINGPDDLSQQKIINSGEDFRDPYPVTADSFLVAQGTKLILMRANGSTSDIYALSGTLAANGALLHEPRPIMSRPKEPVLAQQVKLSDSTGKLLVLDTYIGRNMVGVNRGDIKKLLVLESLPKPVNYTGGMDPMSYGGSFTLDRIIGTVPVEPDGSAYMELPANRAYFFVALDSNDLSVKRMQSFATVMPGENNSCIGCHEERTMIAPNLPLRQALQKPANKPQPVPGMPAIIDYPRDIQPIWNKYCLGCHDVDKRNGGVLLTGDNGPHYTLSFIELSKRMQMADGRNNIRSNYAPRTIGSVASPLMKKVNGSHNSVTLTAQELRLVKLWLDASATYPGTYAALGWGMFAPYIENEINRFDLQWPSVQAAADVMNRRCNSCHTGTRKLATSPSDNLGLNTWELAYNGGGTWFYPLPWLEATAIPSFSGSYAVDGIKTANSGNPEGEWASKGELNPWIQLTWAQAQSLNSVVLYDRPNTIDFAPGGLLTFSDGSSVQVSGIANEGTAKTVGFSTRSVTWVKFQVQVGSGQNVGLIEFEAFTPTGSNVAPLSSVTVSSAYNGNPVGSDYGVNVGSSAWMKKYADPRLQFHQNTIYNLTRPDKSVILLAPLAKTTGGYGTCGSVFANASDADYLKLLKMVQDAKFYMDTMTRFTMANFKPPEEYIREMKRYGILPSTFKRGDPINVYDIDKKYWESLWWKPQGVGVTSVIKH